MSGLVDNETFQKRRKERDSHRSIIKLDITQMLQEDAHPKKGATGRRINLGVGRKKVSDLNEYRNRLNLDAVRKTLRKQLFELGIVPSDDNMLVLLCVLRDIMEKKELEERDQFRYIRHQLIKRPELTDSYDTVRSALQRTHNVTLPLFKKEKLRLDEPPNETA